MRRTPPLVKAIPPASRDPAHGDALATGGRPFCCNEKLAERHAFERPALSTEEPAGALQPERNGAVQPRIPLGAASAERQPWWRAFMSGRFEHGVYFCFPTIIIRVFAVTSRIGVGEPI